MSSQPTQVYPSSKSVRFRQKLSRIRPNESASGSDILRSMLMPNEHVLHIGKVSGGIYWKSLALFLVTAIFLLTSFLFGLPWQLLLVFGIFLAGKTIIMFVIAYLTKHYLLLAATDKRVIIRVGILNLEIIQLRYSKVESSEVASTIPGRLMGYSSVFISGTGGHTLAVPFIENAAAIRNAVTEILMHRDDLTEHENESD